jgi:hypothetical protein
MIQTHHMISRRLISINIRSDNDQDTFAQFLHNMPPHTSSKTASGSQKRSVTITPALDPQPRQGSRSVPGSRSRPQGGHTSGEEFDFEAMEDGSSELEDNVGSQPLTQQTSRSMTKAQDIKLIFEVIETEELGVDEQKLKKRICTWW